jgi:hypothetical protein
VRTSTTSFIKDFDPLPDSVACTFEARTGGRDARSPDAARAAADDEEVDVLHWSLRSR